MVEGWGQGVVSVHYSASKISLDVLRTLNIIIKHSLKVAVVLDLWFSISGRVVSGWERTWVVYISALQNWLGWSKHLVWHYITWAECFRRFGCIASYNIS